MRKSPPPVSADVPVDLVHASSIDDLKRRGRFREVKAEFQERLGSRVRVRARSWAALLEAIQRVAATCAPRRDPDAFFVDESAEAIFALLELDGDAQFRRLGITVRHFGHRRLARAWRDRLAKLVHPDRCAHPKAPRAMAEVSEIYESMLESAS